MFTGTISMALIYDIQLMNNIQLSNYIDIKRGRILSFKHMVLVHEHYIKLWQNKAKFLF